MDECVEILQETEGEGISRDTKPDNAIPARLFNHEMNKITSTSMPKDREKPKMSQLYTKNNSQLCKAGSRIGGLSQAREFVVQV